MLGLFFPAKIKAYPEKLISELYTLTLSFRGIKFAIFGVLYSALYGKRASNMINKAVAM